MAETRTVGIKQLKNNLSAWLREVRRGTRVLVSDRNRVVAELHEPGATYQSSEPGNTTLADWVDREMVRVPAREKQPLPPSPLRVADGAAQRLLDEDRGGATSG